MAQSSGFKRYARGAREMLVESSYSTGMQYTDSPLDETYLKTLVNFDYKEEGRVLMPRGGFQVIQTVALPDQDGERTRIPLVTGDTNVTLIGNVHINDYRTKCFLTSELAQGLDEDTTQLPEYTENRRAILYDNSAASLYIQDTVDETFKEGILCEELPTETTEAVLLDRSAADKRIYLLGEGYNTQPLVHGIPLHSAGTQRLITTTLNNELLLLYKDTKPNLGRLACVEKAGEMYYSIEKVAPLEVTPREVITSGYNMLSDKPYEFENTAAATYNIQGIVPYDGAPGTAGRQVLLTARQGQSVHFQAYYDYPETTSVTLRARWEYADAGAMDNWEVLMTQLATNTATPSAQISPDYTVGDPISINFAPTFRNFQLKLSLYSKTGSTISAQPVAVIILPSYTLATEDSVKRNLKPANYNLATAAGLASWKQRVYLWGVSGGEHILFYSDVNNPTYFPYPNAVTIFDEAIIHVVPYVDVLLVFTATKIYSVTLSGDGLSLITRLLQTRLSFSPLDKHVIQIIKNMVFFKSDNYYYMIVPKASSLTGELTVAPVSRPVMGLLDNFKPAIRGIIDQLYFRTVQGEYDFNLLNYYNYVDSTIVRNVYTFHITSEVGLFEPFTFNVMLNYDTNLRTWSLYIMQGNTTLLPFKQTVTDNTILLDVRNTVVDGKTHSIAQFIRANNNDPRDTFELDQQTERLMPNYQLLDTGFRRHSDQHKKRYREMQFKLTNISQQLLTFLTEFYIDAERRKNYYKYITQHITNPEDPNYGLIYVDRVVEDSLTLAGATRLAEDEEQSSAWTLDFSQFPATTSVKVRLPVSGKGYSPKLVLLSFNESMYELLNINWVFRTLYGR